MQTNLIQFQQRINELETLAVEVGVLGRLFVDGDAEAQPSLSIKGHTWRLGAQGLLERIYPERLEEFGHCYDSGLGMHQFLDLMVPYDSRIDEKYHYFLAAFAKARGIVLGSMERLKSMELNVLVQLSASLVLDEFETAERLFDVARSDESMLRAAGSVARVALERHLFTVCDAHQITVEHNPPSKKKPEGQDAYNSLKKAAIITEIQRSELQNLFAIGNNCAHPKDPIRVEDIRRLIGRGKELAVSVV